MKEMDVKSVLKVKKYRERGLGIREIARVMQKDPTQIMRWKVYLERNPQLSVDNG